jgi:hypothetical protein
VEGATREFLERHLPLLHYDPQAAYRALAASAITDWRGNVLRRGRRVLAESGGSPPLELATLTAYPAGESPERGDMLDERSDSLRAAARFQDDSAYAERVYGRVVQGRRTWLQYWFFYYYNPHALLGIARHEGDWEMVQVGLSDEGEPEVATFAQHTFGQALLWDDVLQHPPPDGPRPVVFVAPLSNASYPEPGTFPYLGGIDHPSEAGEPVTPVLEEFGDWVDWPGLWGGSRGVLGGRLGGRSPESPAGQRLRWEDPDGFHERHAGPSAGRSLRALLTEIAQGPRPRPPVISARLQGRRMVVEYELPGGPLGRGRLIYVTVHDAGSPERTLGRAGRQALLANGTIAIQLKAPADGPVLVRASAFSQRQTRSDAVEIFVQHP